MIDLEHRINNIPLFDCLTHPTLSGNWHSDSEYNCADMGLLLNHMEDCNVQWAFAVGMKGIGDYDEDRYSTFVRSFHSHIFPIAYFDFAGIRGSHAVRQSIISLKGKAYRGIKIHPRHSRISLKNPLIPQVISHAREHGLVVMLCTYLYDMHANSYFNNLENLCALLHEIRDCKIILLHAGTVRLMEMIEIARSYTNVLLDLSFTLCKYEGSSIDMDIAYAFKNFDRRICIGSDYPEFPLKKMRERYEYFCIGLDQIKQKNIASGNLLNFLGLNEHEAI